MARKKVLTSKEFTELSTGVRLSSHEKICAERMKVLHESINELKKEVKSLRQDVSKGKGMVQVLVFFGTIVAGVIGFFMLNQELMPREDRGSVRIFLTGPDGASLAYSDAQARKVEAILQPYKDKGVITDIYSVIGRWDKNRAFITGTLKDWILK